jgi:hypothetical protein
MVPAWVASSMLDADHSILHRNRAESTTEEENVKIKHFTNQDKVVKGTGRAHGIRGLYEFDNRRTSMRAALL